MTPIESMMLTICFSAVMGVFIGDLLCIICEMRSKRKLKKKEKEESM